MKHTVFTLFIITILSSVSNAQSIQLVRSFENNDTVPKYYCQYAEFNNKLYFTSGNYLWVSDGTAPGTHALYGFRNVNGLTVLGNKLIFMADDSTHGWELWVSDGTKSGTSILVDINPGTEWGVYGRFSNNLNGNYENNIARTSSSIYFYGNDGQHGIELWRSDGTPSGTYMVTDINSSPKKGIIDTPAIGQILTAANNSVFFYADDSIHGFELWVSDGTATGTKLIKDVLPGKTGTQSQRIPYHNMALFNAGGLNITDGNNVVQLGDITIGSSDIVEYNGTALFFGYSPIVGGGLIITDGTSANTKILCKIQGHRNYHNERRIDLTKFQNNVYFTGNNPDSVAEIGLWKTDGTVSGTSLIYRTIGRPSGLTAINGKLYFKVQDPTTREVDIWESDGTSNGTRKTQNSFTKPTGSILIGEYLLMGNFTSYKNQPFFVHWYVIPNSKAGLYRIGFPDNVERVEQQTTISIYPNPTQSVLTVSARDMSSVSVNNIAGIVVHKEDVSGENVVINARNWTPGTYIATIRTIDGQTTHRKIIKE